VEPLQTGQGARVGGFRAGIGSGMAGNSRRKRGLSLAEPRPRRSVAGTRSPFPKNRGCQNGADWGKLEFFWFQFLSALG